MQTFYQVDAFTDEPFQGNPASVFVLEKPLSESMMQNIAMEMNLSETAFVCRDGNEFNLRWFTPVREVPLCGHATLASAKILFESGVLRENEPAIFNTKSGKLIAKKNNDFIEMDFPLTTYEKIEINDELQNAVGENILQASNTREDVLVELESEYNVRNFTPNFNAILNLPYRVMIITAKGKDEYDFVSRFFVPKIGINEDPVTGSAHCVLSRYWFNKTEKKNFTAYQASKRGGVVQAEIVDDRVKLLGKAVVVFKGVLSVTLE